MGRAGAAVGLGVVLATGASVAVENTSTEMIRAAQSLGDAIEIRIPAYCVNLVNKERSEIERGGERREMGG